MQLSRDQKLLQKLVSAPTRLCYYVDVGGMDPREVDNYLRKIRKAFKKKTFVTNNFFSPLEMESKAMTGTKQKTPMGVDEKVWKGVLVGLGAMRARTKVKASKTVCFDIERTDQRLFNLPATLDEEQAENSTVVLNGTECVYGRDFRISGSILNWISERKLYRSDSVAIRYADPTVRPPKLNVRPVSGGSLGLVDPSAVSDLDARVNRLETSAANAFKKLNERMAEIDSLIESLDGDVENLVGSVRDLNYYVTEDEEHTEKAEDVEVCAEDTNAIASLPEKEEDDMIESGVKVWHRLNGDGPWIVVQPTVLDINSRIEGGMENQYKKSYVEVAWTVQTEDGVRDFPEVVLTTRKPKEKTMPFWKKAGIALGVVATTAAVVHAPLILKLLGLLQ